VSAIPIVIDCDPGHDDALAIVLALARPELKVLGLTTVAGNASLADTTRNALRVLALIDRSDVPVAAGADRPLVRALETAPLVHGASGLDGADLPEPASDPVGESAVAFLRATISSSPDPVTLVPVGPLTNIATLLLAHPGVESDIDRICLMGGAIREGNWTPAAEFNVWADPEAARIVFRSGVPISMMGLDVTHQARFTAADIARLEAVATPAARVFADLLRFFASFHAQRYGWDWAPVHDAVAVAHVAIPGLVETVSYPVDVETTGGLTRGRTVVDTRGVAGDPPNVEVGLSIDRERFVELLIDAVASFP
jgi:pyrimidine-specific ribonucleoside hydrolase